MGLSLTPDLLGLTLPAATRLARSSAVKLRVRALPDGEAPAGTIATQYPAPGNTMRRGGTIHVGIAGTSTRRGPWSGSRTDERSMPAPRVTPADFIDYDAASSLAEDKAWRRSVGAGAGLATTPDSASGYVDFDMADPGAAASDRSAGVSE